MFVANLTGAVTSVTFASIFANNSPPETVILLQAKVNACVGIVSVVVVVAGGVVPTLVVVVPSLPTTVVCSSCCGSSLCVAVP